MVPKEYNAKGIGLFLQGYCNLVHAVDKFPDLQAEVGTRQELLARVRELADLLISLQSEALQRSVLGL